LIFPNIIDHYVDPTWLSEQTVVAHRKYAALVNREIHKKYQKL
jgi:hypothetical protein